MAGTAIIPPVSAVVSDDFDFLNELDFQPEDAEDLEQMSDMGINTEQETEEEDEEKDEFMDEFSDNDGYDPDDLQKDEY
jgi:hypothetical protein